LEPRQIAWPGDIVRIRHTVTYDSATRDADVIGIDTGGMLRLSAAQSTRLQVGTLLVLPNGTLEIGTSSSPIPASLTAEIIIKNKSLNPSADPDQFGTGLLSIDGKVTMYGAVKTPTFVRTATEPRAGQTVIQLERAVSGWKAGDRLFIPDSRQVDENNKFNSNYLLQIDEVTVQSISADGRSVTVSPALRYDHRGAKDANGNATVLSDGTKLLPHVGSLTRNVIIRSESPSGTRGHTLFTNRSDVDIYYVQFQDLGRTRATALDSSTNHIGRYPLHIHHLWGPVNSSNTGYQFELVGNAINDSLKWPIAVHGSHYGLVKQNVVFGGSQLTGAGIAVEDGSETENLFEENFVANVRGNVNPRESGPDTANGTTPGSAAECFWAAGFNNRFINNVASDCRNPFQQIVSGPGWKFIVPPAPYTAQAPRFRGADMTNTTQTLAVTPQLQPILEFRGNEVYGGSAAGLTIWNLGTDGYNIPTVSESIIKHFRVWHTYEAAVWNYPVNQLTIDGLVWH
jgi:G8 domain